MKSTCFCFDLDGTVTKQEILPLISKNIGLNEEIGLLTDITLKGLIPFQTSFKLRVKLLSQILISTVQRIVSDVILDKEIVKFIQSCPDDCYIITGNLDVWIDQLITDKIKCKYYSSKASFEGDSLTGINTILDKGSAVKELRDSYEQIVTIGDSMNDCSMFEKADIKISFGGVHEPVDTLKKISDYIIYDSRSLCRLLNNIKNES